MIKRRVILLERDRLDAEMRTDYRISEPVENRYAVEKCEAF